MLVAAVLVAFIGYKVYRSVVPEPVPKPPVVELSPHLEFPTPWELHSAPLTGHLEALLQAGYSNLDYRFETRLFAAQKGGTIYTYRTTTNK